MITNYTMYIYILFDVIVVGIVDDDDSMYNYS